MRRNSGDEEIRKLLRSMNENPTAALAERLLAALRRRDDGLTVTVIALTAGRELPVYYEVEHDADLKPSRVVDALRDAVQNWLDTAQGSEGAPSSLAWGDGLSYLEEKDWKNAGLRLLGTVGADTIFDEDEGFFPLDEEANEEGDEPRGLPQEPQAIVEVDTNVGTETVRLTEDLLEHFPFVPGMILTPGDDTFRDAVQAIENDIDGDDYYAIRVVDVRGMGMCDACSMWVPVRDLTAVGYTPEEAADRGVEAEELCRRCYREHSSRGEA
jgi:hypothetical protein